MWTRAELKTRAKAILRVSYWRALLVSIIIVVAGGSFMSNSGNNGRNSSGKTYNTNAYSQKVQRQAQRAQDRVERQVQKALRRIESQTGLDVDSITIHFDEIDASVPENNFVRSNTFPGFLRFPFLFLAGILSLFVGLTIILFRVLIGYNLEVGGRRYFLRAAQGDERLSNTFNNIKSATYVNIISAMFLRSLYTFLWSLLFVIPGIVKGYAYRMVPYILAENPGMAPSEAIAESVRLTNGQKMNMFVLDLSFIGWYILGSMVFGIGRVFVHPYVESTYAQLYLTLTGRSGVYTTYATPDAPQDDYIDARQSN